MAGLCPPVLCDAAGWEGKTSANPCDLWQGFADKQLVPKECATSTDSALESKDLNPGLRLLKLVRGVWSRCKLPHEHKMRRLCMLKSHVCSLKGEASPRAQRASVQDIDPSCSGREELCPAAGCSGACESSVRKGQKCKGAWGLQGSLWCLWQPLCSLWLQRGERSLAKSNCACTAERVTGLKSAPSWKCKFARAECKCWCVLLMLIQQHGGNFHISLTVHGPTPLRPP